MNKTETLKQWALTVAVSAAAGAVILMLTPDGALNKSVRTAVSLFMVIAMLSPFIKGIDFDDFTLNYETAEETDLTETVKEQMKTVTENKIIEILSEYGIKAEGINIDISTNGETLTVEKITVFMTDSTNINNVKEKIKSELGVEVDFEVSG